MECQKNGTYLLYYYLKRKKGLKAVAAIKTIQKEKDFEKNQETIWKKLEDLAAKGTLLLIADNVNVSFEKDKGLKRLCSLLAAILLTSEKSYM